ncbi:MAG: alpha/beta hydrolase [Planctomycetia bacterium]|nr:alpha/beta hydrolase [Planctomycetia bacterium]
MSQPASDAKTAAPPRRRRPWQRAPLRVLLFAIGFYLAVMVAMMLLERSMIFFPSSDGDWNPSWLQFEDVNFQAADGTKLHGWFLPHPNPREMILFAHGNAGNLSHRASTVDRIRRDHQVSIMIFDYRGYGKSEGVPDEEGILADARAARAWLAQRTGRAEKEIVLMGESLGGGVMVDLAVNDGARALILENTFTSLPDVGAYHYPWLPVRWLMRTRLDSASKIPRYTGPLLMVHAEYDEVIPMEFGRRLYDLAGSETKLFLPLKGQFHNDDPMTPGYETALKAFFSRLPPLAAAGKKAAGAGSSGGAP